MDHSIRKTYLIDNYLKLKFYYLAVTTGLQAQWSLIYMSCRPYQILNTRPVECVESGFPLVGRDF